MEKRVEHLLVRSVELVETKEWNGRGAFNIGSETADPRPQETVIQALVKAEYGPNGIKPRPTDGMTLHWLTHPEFAPKTGDVIRITMESMPEDGWPDWINTEKDLSKRDPVRLQERELLEKDCNLAVPGGRSVKDY